MKFISRMTTAGWILLAALALNGCSIIGDDTEATPWQIQHVYLHEGGQFSYKGEFGTLKIGAGTYNIEDYTTDEGEKKHGWTLILWLVIEGHPETYKAIRVYIGQTILFEKYNIHVVKMGHDRPRHVYGSRGDQCGINGQMYSVVNRMKSAKKSFVVVGS